MERNRIIGLVLTIITILGGTALTKTTVPPQPANQNPFVCDNNFQNLTTETGLYSAPSGEFASLTRVYLSGATGLQHR